MGTATWSCTWAPVSKGLQMSHRDEARTAAQGAEGNLGLRSLTLSFHRCFLSTYYVPGALLGSKNTVGLPNSQSPSFLSFESGGGDGHRNTGDFGGLSRSCLSPREATLEPR